MGLATRTIHNYERERKFKLNVTTSTESPNKLCSYFKKAYTLLTYYRFLFYFEDKKTERANVKLKKLLSLFNVRNNFILIVSSHVYNLRCSINLHMSLYSSLLSV